MSGDPDDKKEPAPELFPYDEMSTGVASALTRRAQYVAGTPDLPVADPSLKPMTGAQMAAYRPSAPVKPTTGSHAALKPTTGTHAAFRPTAPPPGPRPSTGTHAAFKPGAAKAPPEETEEPPVFDPEKLQAQIRSLSLTDSALGRAAASGKPVRAPKLPPSAAEDTFVKTKMKQAESKVPDFNLDEDLG